MKSLSVFYSLTGNTSLVASKIDALSVIAKDIADGQYIFAARTFVKTLEQEIGQHRQDVA